MRQHANLPAMMSFVGKHVAQHLDARRPGARPAVPMKLLDSTIATEPLLKHLGTASGTLDQCRTSLFRRAVRAIELRWNLQIRSCQPDPLAADIVYVAEDRCDIADCTGRLRSPRGR